MDATEVTGFVTSNFGNKISVDTHDGDTVTGTVIACTDEHLWIAGSRRGERGEFRVLHTQVEALRARPA